MFHKQFFNVQKVFEVEKCINIENNNEQTKCITDSHFPTIEKIV